MELKRLKSQENHTKIARFYLLRSLFLLAKSRYYLILTFEILRTEKTRDCKVKKASATPFSQFAFVQVKKILKKISGSISGKAKKIEALV